MIPSNYKYAYGCTDLNDPKCDNNRQFGVILESGISGFELKDNTFKRIQGNGLLATIGILCTDMGSNSYTIKDNQFSDLTFGNVAHKNNSGTGTGLTYLCNTNNNNIDDFYVTLDPNSSVSTLQGLIDPFFNTLPAYNKFSFSSNNVGWDFRNNAPYPQLIYYCDGEDNLTRPREGHYENITIKDADKNENHCKEKGTSGPTGPWPDKHQLMKRYFEASDAYHSALIAKDQAEMQNNMALSEQKTKESHYFKLEADDAAYNGYLYSILDTTGSSTDSIPVWLGRMQSFEAEISRADWYRQKGQLAQANTILSELPSKLALTNGAMTDLTLYRGLRELGDSEYLDNTTLYQLEEAADSDFRYSSAYAKNILSRHGIYYPPITFEMLDAKTSIKQDQSTSEDNRLRLSVTPNPSSGYVFLDWSQFDLGAKKVTIELRDRVGNLLGIFTSSPWETTKEFSLEAYQDGVIFYYLRSNEKLLDSGQIILSK